MLMNNLDPEVAERPEDLVVYGGTGKAARDWPSYHALVRTLTTLRDDETMLVQSGRPVGVFRTHEWAPRVLLANSNLVGDWATWPEFRRLEALGLTMYGQMTAGSWIYIGTQGILQGTYETFAAVAAKRFGGTLAGTLTLTAGCGGMGGAQPLAVTMNGGACLIVDVDRDPAATAGCTTRYLDDGRRLPGRRASRRRWPPSGSGGRCRVGVVGNAADGLPRAAAPRRARSTSSPTRPARTTRCPTCRRASTWPTRRTTRPTKPEEFTDRARASMAKHVEAMVGFLDAGAEVFDYGNSIRGEAQLGGYERAFAFPGFVPGVHPAAVLRGQGPVPVGGALRRPGRHRRHRPGHPRPVPGERVAGPVDPAWPASGSPSRACRPGSAGSATASGTRPGVRFNEMVAARRAVAPRSSSAATTSTAARRLARTGRPRRCATAPTRSPTGRCSTRWSTPPAARPGCPSTTAAASASAGPSTPGRSASPTAPRWPAQKIERVLTNDPAWA